MRRTGTGNPVVMVREINRASWYGPETAGRAAIDVGLGAASLVAWAMTGSVSMLAAAVVALVVGTNESVAVALGRRPDRLAIALFAVGSLATLAAGFDALRGTHVVTANPLGYGVLAAAFWLEDVAVLAEDRGAFTGLVVALAGATSAALSGNTRYDALGSIGIGVLLAVAAVVLVQGAGRSAASSRTAVGVLSNGDDVSIVGTGRS